MQSLEDAADQRYDDDQAAVGTPVTDLAAPTTPTSGGPATTATIPPVPTTTSTTSPLVATTTSTTSTPSTPTTPTTLGTLTFIATGGESNPGNNDWWIDYRVTASAATAATVTITWPGGSRTSCSLPCQGRTTPLFDKHVSSASISTTTVAGFAGPAQTTITVAEP